MEFCGYLKNKRCKHWQTFCQQKSSGGKYEFSNRKHSGEGDTGKG